MYVIRTRQLICFTYFVSSLEYFVDSKHLVTNDTIIVVVPNNKH